MPMTPAEKQRKYRERLKTNNPEKYEDMKKKSSENALKYYRNKRDNYINDQKEEQRLKWKENREKAKEQMLTTLQQKTTNKEVVNLPNIQRRIEYKFQKENFKLRKDLSTLSKGFKSLQKKFNRQQKKLYKMNENYENVMIRLKMLEESTKSDETGPINDIRPNIPDYTPRKRVDELINENIPNIETPKKEVIKQKLLEYDILTETLKLEMQGSNNAEKNTFKKILNNDLVKKYKHKTKLTLSLGFKSNLKQRSRALIRKTMQLRKKIEEFYNRDDVTRATAGKKEYRVFKKNTQQIRYQLDKLKVLHKKYVTEVGKISFSTFKKYRPFYVLPPKIGDCETCACVKHSNMQFLVDTLKKQGLLIQESLDEVISEFVCEFKSKECMYGDCVLCADKKLDINNDKEETEEIKWYEWVFKEHEYGRGDKTKKIKRMMKITKEGTLRDLLNTFNTEIKKLKNVFNFYYQLNKCKDCKKNLKDNEAIVHIDFSENFTCKYHKEVQAMHFIKDQITLHTGVIYLKNDDHTLKHDKHVSYCSISPNNEHGPEAIWAHLDPILKYIKSHNPNVTILHFFSDGPSTQYRQKKNFYLFSKKNYEYGFEKGTWSYFEAAHGKGAADGIGGAIKRRLEDEIAKGVDIPDAKTAFEVLSMSDTDVKIFFIATENINLIDIKLTPIPGTMQIHQIMTDSILKIRYRHLSCFCNDLNGMCDCDSPMSHDFNKILDLRNREPKKSNKRKLINKENTEYSVKYRKRRKSRNISTSSEESIIDIEYANSDVTCYIAEDLLSLDISDDKLDISEDISEKTPPFELDERTGVLRPNMDSDKTNIIVPLVVKKANDEKVNNKDCEIKKDTRDIESEDVSKNKKYRKTGEYKAKEDEQRTEEDRNKVERGASKAEKSIIKVEYKYTAQKDQLSSENVENSSLKINDAVIVRYYIRKTWKYYVGFIINVKLLDSEHHYEIQFLKTNKDATRFVKFTAPKKRDIDLVPMISIVKQVNLIQEKDSNEYYFNDDNDKVYF